MRPGGHRIPAGRLLTARGGGTAKGDALATIGIPTS